jgi:hypothetical protein
MNTSRVQKLTTRLGNMFIAICLLAMNSASTVGAPDTEKPLANPDSINEQASTTSIPILVDDFKPQRYQGDAAYYYNRLNGDRGALNNSLMDWGIGYVRATVASGNTWAGIWESLNHPIREGLSIDFSTVLPGQIVPAYQSQITGISVRITGGTPGRPLRLELKDGNTLRWSSQINLSGGAQIITSSLPSLGTVNQLVLVLDNAAGGDYVTVERVSFIATTQITDSATKAFVWSYAMLLANWAPDTGLVRDSAKVPSGDFDAIQSTGSLAAATALAEQLGVISHNDAVAIVTKISDTLLNHIPRFRGLWPHWVKVSNGTINILANTEWSSVDTVIAAIALLDAQIALGLDPVATEQMLRSIDWNNLKTPNGISHGYDFAGNLIPFAWDVFGGESWFTALAFAAVTSQVAPLAYASPPTANGSGFIDELAWLFVPPPSVQDAWGVNWSVYRSTAAQTQINYHPDHYPSSCFAQKGLFGLSAAEAANPAGVAKGAIYQAFGVGGAFANPNDGSALLGAPVVTPHYSAMIASLRPAEAIKMWDWLIAQEYFSPLNNVESLMYSPANSGCSFPAVFNDLKGSWNLALQTLGWGRYLAQKNGRDPSIWIAATQNSFLRKGYLLLVENGLPLGPELDEDASKWSVFAEGSPTWALNNVASPSLDGRSLRCAITGGQPNSNVHCYINLPADPTSNRFTLGMSFLYRPASSFNDAGGVPSIVQALEFTMNKYYHGLRYEWAVQWDNVNDAGDTGAPKWRYWGRANPADPLKWLDLGISGSLAPEPQWHTLKLDGEIIDGQVHYTRFTLDAQAYPLNFTVPPASTNEPDKLAVAVQLDGNSMETPYEGFLDKVNFQHLSSIDTTGVFRPSNGLLYLKNANTTGFADVAINYGLGGDYPVTGDWDGNGTATIGIYRNGSFYLRNSNTIGFADIVFAFGMPGDQPIAGDWDGNGTDTIGVYRPSTGQFLLRNSNTNSTPDMSFYLGNVGDVGIAGDWNGDGKDTTGVFRPSNGVIFLKNANSTGFADIALNYGLAGDQPVTGDWNGDGKDTIGVYRNGLFYLRNSNTIGFAEIVFGLGNPGDMPIAGDWNGIP